LKGAAADIRKRTILCEHLASHYLLVEEGLTVLDASGETLLLGIIDQRLDGITLLPGGSLGLLLLGARLATLVSPQVAAEIGMAASLVIEVGGIC
jgi:hypothetical protein